MYLNPISLCRHHSFLYPPSHHSSLLLLVRLFPFSLISLQQDFSLCSSKTELVKVVNDNNVTKPSTHCSVLTILNSLVQFDRSLILICFLQLASKIPRCLSSPTLRITLSQTPFWIFLLFQTSKPQNTQIWYMKLSNQHFPKCLACLKNLTNSNQSLDSHRHW